MSKMTLIGIYNFQVKIIDKNVLKLQLLNIFVSNIDKETKSVTSEYHSDTIKWHFL